jgi:hypothetical protein
VRRSDGAADAKQGEVVAVPGHPLAMADQAEPPLPAVEAESTNDGAPPAEDKAESGEPTTGAEPGAGASGADGTAAVPQEAKRGRKKLKSLPPSASHTPSQSAHATPREDAQLTKDGGEAEILPEAEEVGAADSDLSQLIEALQPEQKKKLLDILRTGSSEGDFNVSITPGVFDQPARERPDSASRKRILFAFPSPFNQKKTEPIIPPSIPEESLTQSKSGFPQSIRRTLAFKQVRGFDVGETPDDALNSIPPSPSSQSRQIMAVVSAKKLAGFWRTIPALRKMSADRVRQLDSTMIQWRMERANEIKSRIIEELRRTYITLTKDDEECKNLDIILNNLQDVREGPSRGICQDLSERLRGSFSKESAKKVTKKVSQNVSLPGAVADNGSLESLPDASQTPDRESEAKLLLTRARFSKQLARALRTTDDPCDPCVLALLHCETPVVEAEEPEDDLLNVAQFCEKYGNLSEWAQQRADLESDGVARVLALLQKVPCEEGLALMQLVPRTKESIESTRALIETGKEFLEYLREEGAGEEAAGDGQDRLSRKDVGLFLKNALLGKYRKDERADMPLLDEFDEDSLIVEPEPSSQRSLSCSQPQAQGQARKVNLCALFPGWSAQGRISVPDFISKWLVGKLKVPLAVDGVGWIKELEPSVALDEQVGGVFARCLAVSAPQRALILGQCSMSVQPLLAEQGGAEGKTLLSSVSQVMHAYAQTTGSDIQDSLDSAGSKRVNSAISGVGCFQAVLTNDGLVYLDCDLLSRYPHEDSVQLQNHLQLASDGVVTVDGTVMKQIKYLHKYLVVQIAAGMRTMVCLTSDGSVFSYNCSRQAWRPINVLPTPAPMAAKVVQVACGANHTLAVVDNGLVYGFGKNSHGQLGLSDVQEAFEPTMLLKFERMSSDASLQRVRQNPSDVKDERVREVYVRSNFETIETHVPWIIAVSCGDSHSVFLTADGKLFACGDNKSGQCGYNAMMECLENTGADDSSPLESQHFAAAGPFRAPVLLEGGDVPNTAAQVACGARHTSVLSHTGRVHVYGGLVKKPMPDIASRNVKVWRSVHDGIDGGQGDGEEFEASSLVFDGGQYKILNIACCGDLTLASYSDPKDTSSYDSASNLNFATFWFRKEASLPWTAQVGFEAEASGASGDASGLFGLQKSLESERDDQQVPGKDLSKLTFREMKGLAKFAGVMSRLYSACRSPYPAVREHAVSLWASSEQLVVDVHKLSSSQFPFRRILEGLFGYVREKSELGPNTEQELLFACQLILYRATQKRTTLDIGDIEYLQELGVEGKWRPHVLHDRLWNGLDTASSASPDQSGGPFVILEQVLLAKKLEVAALLDFSESKLITTAIKVLSPRADLAVLYLARRCFVAYETSPDARKLMSKEYVVEVITGKGPTAATDSHVYIDIVGSHSSSGEKALVFSENNVNAFESGKTDRFTLACSELGRIKKVVIRNEGSSMKSKWKLDEIRIWQVGNEQLVYDFQHYGWLDARNPEDSMRQEIWYDPEEKMRYEYLIEVTTLDKKGAGTSAGVFLTLFGEMGNSKRQRLEETDSYELGEGGSRSRLFQQGKTSKFRVPVAGDLGLIKRIVIGTTSWGPNVGWTLESLKISQMIRGPVNLTPSVEKPELTSLKDWQKTFDQTFTNHKRVAIGSCNHLSAIELFPEQSNSHSTVNTKPALAPSEGCFSGQLDVRIHPGDVKSEFLLTALYVPSSEVEGKLRGRDWIDSEETNPQHPNKVVPVPLIEGVPIPPRREGHPPTSDDDMVQAIVKPDDAENWRVEGDDQADPAPADSTVLPPAESAVVNGQGFGHPGEMDAAEEKHVVLPPEFYAGVGESQVTYKMEANPKVVRFDASQLVGDDSFGGTLYIKVRKLNGTTMSEVACAQYQLVKSRPRKIYRVYVYTGNFPEASTTANVFMILKGKYGQTQVQPLDSRFVLLSNEKTSGTSNTPTTRRKAFLAEVTGKGQRQIKSVGLFDSNSEAAFQFDAEDVGDIDEILIWHDNRQNMPFTDPEWYLHRVEVYTTPAAEEQPGVHDLRPAEEKEMHGGSSRTFFCRKWLTTKGVMVGTQARLIYKEVQNLEPLPRTYDFAVVLPKGSEANEELELPFNSIVLFGERMPRGMKFSVPHMSKMDVYNVGDAYMYCFKEDMGLYFGTLQSAILIDRKGGEDKIVDLSKEYPGIRMMVKCYERAAFYTVHFSPARIDDSFVLSVVSACSAPLSGASGKPMQGLRVSRRQLEDEPTIGSSKSDFEAAGQLVPAAGSALEKGAHRDRTRRKHLHKQKVISVRTMLNALDLWLNIVQSDEFDEEETLQQMIPACARLSLVSVAKRGALQIAQLEKLQFVFDQDRFPIELTHEIDFHQRLMMMDSIFAIFDKWRTVELNSFELEDVDHHRSFAWNLLYCLCCTNPGDPAAVSFVLERGGFEKTNIRSDDNSCLLRVNGIEQDFALILHFIVLRQICVRDIQELQKKQSAAERRKAAESMQNQGISWKRRLGRNLNLVARWLFFPMLLLPAIANFILNHLIVSLISTLYTSWSNHRTFSRFERAGLLQPTREEVTDSAKEWRKACSGNYSWTSRRKSHWRQKSWRAALYDELRLVWWNGQIVPAFNEIRRDMAGWFSIGTTNDSAGSQRENRPASQKREQVLHALCRFEPVAAHRRQFAMRCFFRGGLMHLLRLFLLIVVIFNMLGTDFSIDKGAQLTQDLRQMLVDNTFNEVNTWDDWWNFAYGSIVPMLTAQQVYQGVNYRGDLRVSPLLLRQVRTKPDGDGNLPAWGPGADMSMEGSSDLEIAMCAESSESAPRAGCHWSNPPHSDVISAYTRGEAFRSYPASGYIVHLFKDNVMEKLEQVQKGGWFDASTRFVSVEGMVYSESRNRVAYVNLGAEVSVTGWTKSVVRIISFTPSQFGFWHWLFVMIFFAALGHAFEQLLALGPRRYFSSILNCLELLDAAFIFVLFVCQNSIITKMQSFDPSAADPWLKDATPDAFSIDYELISFVQVM